jgi:SET domain-containing protein
MSELVIRNSDIEGKGVFANRNFSKGELVIKWNSSSQELNHREYSKLTESQKKFCSYTGEGKYVLLTSSGRYLNHSCNTNTKHNIAIRNIKRGEEITCDYHIEEVPFLEIKCKCGNNDCKKVIYGKLNCL